MFDSNYGADAAAINLAFYNARFGNVTFKNNTGGSAVRVSMSAVPHIIQLAVPAKLHCPIAVYVMTKKTYSLSTR